jgi:hypothetical protein
MIKRSTILKILKYHGKYERSFFTKKKAELEDICKKLDIDLTQNIDDKPVKEAAKDPVKPPSKPKKVVIQEPDDSSDESSDEDDEEPTQLPQTPAPSPTIIKKLKRKQNQRVEQKVEQKVEPDNKLKVNTILKDLNRAIKELFGEFDQKDLDEDDVIFLQNEFNLTLNEAQDMIDPLVENFTDNEIAKIENKIELMYKKLERFLS